MNYLDHECVNSFGNSMQNTERYKFLLIMFLTPNIFKCMHGFGKFNCVLNTPILCWTLSSVSGISDIDSILKVGSTPCLGDLSSLYPQTFLLLFILKLVGMVGIEPRTMEY
jgi:hypothetical protein